jgi:DNA-binding transcriptional LysR family regulator
VVGREHPLAGRGSVPLEELQHESWVLSPKNYELREATLHACQEAGFTPHVVLDGGEMDTLLQLVAAGVGITIVPRMAVRHSETLVMLKVQDRRLHRSLGMVWRADRINSPAARALRDFLVEHLRESALRLQSGY